MRREIVLGAVLLALGCGESSPKHATVDGPDPNLPAQPAGPMSPASVPSAGNGATGGASGANGSSGKGGSAAIPPELPSGPGTMVKAGELGPDGPAVQALLDDAAKIDAEGLAKKREVAFQDALGYDPLAAQNFDLLQGSALALDDAEQKALHAHGFAILASHEFPSFFYAYLTIYGQDLPVFVSADSVLDAVHRSFDDILADLERNVMVPKLQALLAQMRGALDGQSGQAAADAELFLAVAQSLLTNELPTTLNAGVTTADVQPLFDAGRAASGIQEVELFGVERTIDFSQLKPRGHYEGDMVLEPYFRAMMWLGRTDFQLIATQPDGSQVFYRRQLEAALYLRSLLNADGHAIWNLLDAIVSAFVGEHDYMTVPQLDSLLTDLRVSKLDDSLGDQAIADAIIKGGYGAQRICSQVMINGGNVATLPLGRSFAFFGQRYTVDSHVFSNVVFDRVQADRWLPDPLDAAYAALANDHAVALLHDELARYPYAPNLEAMRLMVDAHPDEYWHSSLYTSWLSALRVLSPSNADARPDATGLPSVARTEAWERRLLNTQLASWSELRHDTLLYVKQSYGVGSVCEFPDAYVEPYPELFAQIGQFATRGHELLSELGLDQQMSHAMMYLTSLGDVMGILEAMAREQRTGMPHSADQLAFINDVVKVSGLGSGPPSAEGWYARLFYNGLRSLEQDPIIADVHTDPGGDTHPAQVLHVATGLPRAMVMTVDTCMGPRLYVGPAFAYHEKRVEGVQRLTDREWASQLTTQHPADVPWMNGIIAR